ncbi:MAG: hypothetical protein CSA81_04295 [Acidobacteria bacterium]|nr:MAG: hypothetical protein CSA81_04295 [Acidobacteriota bacterium]
MNPLFLQKNKRKVRKRRQFFWILAAIVTTVLTLWLFIKNGGITGLTREAMNLSLQVKGEMVYSLSVQFFIKVSAPFFLTLAALFCWWMMMRNWAHYYLNRKLIVSYLFFALIPLLSTIAIFILGARTLFGLTAAHGVESGMQALAKGLNSYTYHVQKEVVRMISEPPGKREKGTSVKREIVDLLERLKKRELSSREFPGFFVSVFYRTARPGHPWLCLNSSPPLVDGAVFFPGIIPPDHPLFHTINPSWLGEREFSGLTRENDRLYLKSFRYFEADQRQFVIQAGYAVNKHFLGRLQERLSVNLALEGLNDSWRITPEWTDSAWYIRFFLRPLRSIWLVEIREWDTGQNQLSAQMLFDAAPNLFSPEQQDGHISSFLGDNQMQIQFAFIIFTIAILVLGELFALIFGVLLIGYITRSLDMLATGNDIVAQGQLSYRLPKMGQDQLGAMARSFNAMVANIQNLLEESKEKEKLQEELRIAREIQVSLLPDLENKAWSRHLDAVCIPAKDVGGDYFEVLEIGDRKLGVFVADVSGKGTSAAFYMAEMKGILLALKPKWGYPVELVNGLNEILHGALKSNIFISAFYVLIDLKTGEAECVRAGHCPAIAAWKDRPCEEIQPKGMALGLTTNAIFSSVISSEKIKLEAGEKLVLYTDGLDEMAAEHELYGINRLKNTIDNQKHLPATQLKEAILNDVNRFIQSGEQSDDLTLVIIQIPENSS